MLQRQGPVTALTQQSTLWLPQGILVLKTNTKLKYQNYFLQREDEKDTNDIKENLLVTA